MSTLFNFNPVQCSQTFARWLQPMHCNCILHLHSLPTSCFQLQPPVCTAISSSHRALPSLSVQAALPVTAAPDHHLGVKLLLRHIMSS